MKILLGVLLFLGFCLLCSLACFRFLVEHLPDGEEAEYRRAQEDSGTHYD